MYVVRTHLYIDRFTLHIATQAESAASWLTEFWAVCSSRGDVVREYLYPGNYSLRGALGSSVITHQPRNGFNTYGRRWGWRRGGGGGGGKRKPALPYLPDTAAATGRVS